MSAPSTDGDAEVTLEELADRIDSARAGDVADADDIEDAFLSS